MQEAIRRLVQAVNASPPSIPSDYYQGPMYGEFPREFTPWVDRAIEAATRHKIPIFLSEYSYQLDIPPVGTPEYPHIFHFQNGRYVQSFHRDREKVYLLGPQVFIDVRDERLNFIAEAVGFDTARATLLEDLSMDMSEILEPDGEFVHLMVYGMRDLLPAGEEVATAG